MSRVATWRSPVLLIHGDDDRNVPFAETVQLVEALRKHKVEFEELIFPMRFMDSCCKEAGSGRTQRQRISSIAS
jgi:hypothetical protein